MLERQLDSHAWCRMLWRPRAVSESSRRSPRHMAARASPCGEEHAIPQIGTGKHARSQHVAEIGRSGTPNRSESILIREPEVRRGRAERHMEVGAHKLIECLQGAWSGAKGPIRTDGRSGCKPVRREKRNQTPLGSTHSRGGAESPQTAWSRNTQAKTTCSAVQSQASGSGTSRDTEFRPGLERIENRTAALRRIRCN